MTRPTRISFTIAAVAGLAVPLAVPAPAAAQSGGRLEYAVKFVCGANFSRPGALSPAAAAGNYFTAINIHNPGVEAPLVYKVVLAPSGRPGRPTSIVSPFRLGNDDAVDFDCTHIAAQLRAAGTPPPQFYTGFFVIQSQTEFDVVAVYTASSQNGPIDAMAMERVPVRRR
jgi:hypothetical protein